MKLKELFLIMILIVSIVVGVVLIIMEMNIQSSLIESSKTNIIKRIK